MSHQLSAGLEPARVTAVHRGRVAVRGPEGTRQAPVAGTLLHEGDAPVVGDWVGVEPGGAVREVLPRLGVLRRSDGPRIEVMAANVDLGLVVTSANGDLNLRRLERFVALVRDGGVPACILLTKADLVDDPDGQAAELRAELGTPVLVVQRPDRRRHRGPGGAPAPAGDHGAHRQLGRRQVDARQHAARRGAPEDAADPRARRPRAPRHDAPRAVRAAGRRAAGRHARRAARGARGRRRPPRHVRRCRQPRRALPLRRLRPRRRSRAARCRTPSPPATWRRDGSTRCGASSARRMRPGGRTTSGSRGAARGRRDAAPRNRTTGGAPRASAGPSRPVRTCRSAAPRSRRTRGSGSCRR